MGVFRWNDRTRMWVSHVSAIGGTIAALQFTQWIKAPQGQESTLLFFLIPISVSAFLGGWKPGLAATSLSGLLSSYFLLSPLHSFWIDSPYDAAKLGALLGTGVLISILAESQHRTKRTADKIEIDKLLVPMERKIWLSFAGALALLAVTGLTSYWELAKLRENDGLVAHTHEVIASLRLVQSLVADAETGQRGFLITGDRA